MDARTVVTFIRELWRTQDQMPEMYLGGPIQSLMAQNSGKAWLVMEVYNGRTMESIQTSDPQDIARWIIAVGPRQVRQVALMIPETLRAHRWARVSVVAVWQARGSGAVGLYFEDADGAAWQPSGLSCAFPLRDELITLWVRAETGSRQRTHMVR